jgi:hypothetical protein
LGQQLGAKGQQKKNNPFLVLFLEGRKKKKLGGKKIALPNTNCQNAACPRSVKFKKKKDVLYMVLAGLFNQNSQEF